MARRAKPGTPENMFKQFAIAPAPVNGCGASRHTAINVTSL